MIFLSSIYQSIFPSYFSFMLQGTFVAYFTMLSPWRLMKLTRKKVHKIPLVVKKIGTQIYISGKDVGVRNDW
jgi:hypothetical protein